MMKKILVFLSFLCIVLGISGINTSAYSGGYSNVYYRSSPYDFTPKMKKYTKSAYYIRTTSLKGTGKITMWPRANRQAVNNGAADKELQININQKINNYAVEFFGKGCDADIAFKIRKNLWDNSRTTSSGTWQPDK